MKNIFYISIVTLLLSGCANPNNPKEFSPVSKVEVVTSTVYPEFPPLTIPNELKLLTVKMDMPRDLSTLVIKDTEECNSVLKEDRDEIFWKKCGENPIIENSNIYIGFDLRNYNNFLINLNRLKERILVLTGIIEQANNQRLSWIEKARLEKERVLKEIEEKTQK